MSGATWEELAKQVPALLVLVVCVFVFLRVIAGMVKQFAHTAEAMSTDYKQSAAATAEVIDKNTRMTTRLYERLFDSRDDGE